MVELRFLHPALAILIVEKRQDPVKGLLGVTEYVGEGSPLAILLEIFPAEGDFGHVPNSLRLQN